MAYEILSNPEKRRLYDQAGEQGIKEGGGGGGGGMGNPMDIFDMFFGGGDPFGRGGGRRGPWRTCTTGPRGSWLSRRTSSATLARAWAGRRGRCRSALTAAAPGCR